MRDGVLGRQLLLAGLAAGALAVGSSFAFRILSGVAYLPEIATSAVFSLVPGAFESAAVETLGPLAKDTAYVVASAVLVLVLAMVPRLLVRFRLLPRRGSGAAAFIIALSAYAVLLALAEVFHVLAQVSTLPVTTASIAAGMLVPAAVFGATYAALAGPPPIALAPLYPAERPKGGYDRKRRLFIKSAAGAAVAAAILYYGVGFLFPKLAPVMAGKDMSQVLSTRVTSNSDFYRVDINVFAPDVDAGTWALAVHGLVDKPVTLDYQTLRSLPSVEEYATLECVSNKPGGDLMSTALWKGVQLKTVLDIAGVGSQSDYVVFRCYDGYDVGIPLDRAMSDGTILAYEMNGVPLPNDHGYPLRAVVPGLYGMMNAKWITDIELVSGAYEGFWQRRGWTNTATYHTSSTVITPGDSPLRDRFPIPQSMIDVTGAVVPLVGVAFGGDRGIQKVEVSEDGGTTWQDASLYDPFSRYTWVFWRLDWTPPASGFYRLVVRATDGDGQVQVATMTDPFPNGATGYSIVDVKVSTP